MSCDCASTTYVVECYWPGVTEAKLIDVVARMQTTIHHRHGRGRAVRYLGSILIQADETVFCLFDGEQPEIAAVSAAAELPFGRILRSRWIA